MATRAPTTELQRHDTRESIKGKRHERKGKERDNHELSIDPFSKGIKRDKINLFFLLQL